MFESVTSTVLKTALDGLAMRQRVTADNIANINTPQFLAGRVQFEDALRQAVEAGQGFNGETRAQISRAALADQATQPSLARSLEPTRTDGNNVNLDRETISNIDTQLRYSLMIRAMDDQYGGIRTVAASGG
ncbi:flagellar basal body rod protein FlgB [Cryptosporangium minutisporangium]|uniref:Flagellar basal body rod protein FlgB n=1 Tax=Cryptosporangium minutisporangium TaxID=113569 RepID=A0ABP6TD45_9ACTN